MFGGARTRDPSRFDIIGTGMQCTVMGEHVSSTRFSHRFPSIGLFCTTLCAMSEINK